MQQINAFTFEGSECQLCPPLLYVDDMLITGQDGAMKELAKLIDMKDLGPTKQILGMMICYDPTQFTYMGPPKILIYGS